MDKRNAANGYKEFMTNCKSAPAGDGASDDTQAIQSLLDSGTSAVHLPPPAKHYLISRPLIIHSNQSLVLDRFAVVRLAPKSDCVMITNDDHEKGNENVAVTGGIWDMDNRSQSPNPIMTQLEQGPGRYDPDRYLGICMRFVGVTHFTLKSVTFRDPVTFCTQFARMRHFTIEDIVFDYRHWNPIAANMDGIHLDGDCRFGRIANLKGATNDDLVAINADDNEVESPCFGPIEDVTIDGIYAEHCHSGVRLLSSGSAVRRITIRNVHGTFYRYAVGFTKFFFRREGTGHFDSIVLENLHCGKSATMPPDRAGEVKPDLPLVYIERGTRVRRLVIRDFHRQEEALGIPAVVVQRGAKVDSLLLDHCSSVNELNQPVDFILNQGAVGSLAVRDFVGRSPAGGDVIVNEGALGRADVCGLDLAGMREGAYAPLPPMLREGEGIVDAPVPSPRLEPRGKAALVADEEAETRHAFELPDQQAAFPVTLEAESHDGARRLPVAGPETGGESYAWRSLGEHDLFYRPESLRLRIGSDKAEVSLAGLRLPAGRYRPWGLDFEPELLVAPGDICANSHFDDVYNVRWEKLLCEDDGRIVLLDKSDEDWGWARGTTYTHVYIHADNAVEGQIHIRQNGVETTAWLDGRELELRNDRTAPLSLGWNGEKDLPATAKSITDQGAEIEVKVRLPQPQQVADISLSLGWHRLTVKWIMRHVKNQPWVSAVKLTDAEGKPLPGLSSQCDVPDIPPEQHIQAARLIPQVKLNAPFNLARAGEPVELTVFPAGFNYHPDKPFIPIEGVLRVRIDDYDGKSVFQQNFPQLFPQSVAIKLGDTMAIGTYAVHVTFMDKKGKAIAVYPPDGFNIIGGTSAMSDRKLAKKMAVTYYFMEEKYNELFFLYMERIGIFRNVGGCPIVGDFQKAADTLYKTASERGLLLCGDFWDKYSNVDRDRKFAAAKAVGQYTRWFKSMNEIDIIPERPSPERWVERTRWEYEAAHAARPDAFYIGGSLVRVGAENQKMPDGELWFDKCLKLGLEKYQDAWDVHAYPQMPPILEGTISNSINETELGVLEAYKRVGMTNHLPFWLGETGARAHGDRRWQADMLAKMVAWANSRNDFQVIGFLVPWVNSREKGMIGDIPVGHLPGEAALYTSGALIDGFDYKCVAKEKKEIQAAWFGSTLMAWTTGMPCEWTTKLDGVGPWVRVDVVGRAYPQELNADGTVTLKLSASPVYILEKSRYEMLVN